MELVPRVDYLIQTDFLDHLGLWAHCQLLILICCKGKVALTSMIVVSHLKAKHDHKVTKQEKAKLDE
ncbi:hypothetical protein JVT61DRAFT_6757 [Boletus reticuloceps]|uniref:Uncharacterized protein n=1 Tax=Boletus reticuloceps TaxID=495285 RepID=A0A8I3A7M6_9AGAM|nr:hypothetical protein JVT61DRAFT_6757 [Boletus reticuloceps]